VKACAADAKLCCLGRLWGLQSGEPSRASRLTSAAEVWLVEGEELASPRLGVGVAVGVLVGSVMAWGSAMPWGWAMP